MRPVLILVAFLAVILGLGAQAKRASAPDFTLKDLKGKTFSLHDYHGKVVLLDFWATWCPPCVLSSPEVEKLTKDYKGKKFEVIRISLDDSPEAVFSYMSSHPITSRIAMTNGDVERDYQVQGIPAFYIIDQNGGLVKSWGGYHPMMPQIWRKEIDRLLS